MHLTESLHVALRQLRRQGARRGHQFQRETVAVGHLFALGHVEPRIAQGRHHHPLQILEPQGGVGARSLVPHPLALVGGEEDFDERRGSLAIFLSLVH